MRVNRKIIVIICGIVILLLVIGIVNYIKNETESRDALLIWGEYQDHCPLWLVESKESLTEIEPVFISKYCKYQLVSKNGIPTLVDFYSRQGVISIFEVLNNRTLKIEELLIDESLKITSISNLDDDGMLYLSGIRNDKESIFQFNLEEKLLQEILSIPDGMVTEPLLSSSGQFISYLAIKGISNREQCSLGFAVCKQSGDYYVLDIEENISEPLSSFANLGFQIDAEDLFWAPAKDILVFNAYDGPAPIIIVDVEENIHLDTIMPGAGIYGWLTDSQFVYQEWDGNKNPRTMIYSLIGNESRTLMASTNDNEWNLIEDVNWPISEDVISGIIRDDEIGNQLIIMELNDKNPQIKFTDLQTTYSPAKWAPSGGVLSFVSQDNIFSEGENSNITVIDRKGQILYSIDTSSINFPQFTWASSLH